MADMEERIYILSKPLYPSVDGWKDAKEKSMTRQEAIGKMAEGMCDRATEAIKSQETVVFDFGFYAEAALDALLGVEK